MPDLKAHISLNSGVILEVTNEDEFDWNNCRLTLNLQIFGRDYELSLARIAAHEHVSLPLDNFASGDGERFDPFTHKLKETAIVCETLGGKAFYTGSFEHKDGS
ncbi:MAG: hypothetical protein JWO52_4082 [Gammaproteobacteria bacterium]|nr:hypothetical protein [Gammaproteobacteria bacterium]